MAASLKSTTSFRAIHTDGLEDAESREHEYIYQYIEYDEKGNILLEETHIPEGPVEHKASYRYDPDGRLIEELLLEEDDFVSEHRTMEYDAKGYLWKERSHYLDGSYDETVCHYDEEGKLLLKETAGDDGESGNRVKIEYNDKHPVSEIEYDADENVVSEKKFEFDEAGNLVSESIKSQDENYELFHEYDEKGNRSVSKRYDEQGQLIERSTYSRDEQGKATQVKEESVTGIEVLNNELDERGNIIVQETVTDNDELISRIERSYDDHDQVVITHVQVVGHGQRPSQDYRIRFEYTYYD